MRKFLKSMSLVIPMVVKAIIPVSVVAVAASAPQKVEAAAGVDGFVWLGAQPAVGATVEVINTQTGRVAWRGTANRYHHQGRYRNYYATGILPSGTYRVRVTYNRRSGVGCCAITNGTSWPTGFFARQNVVIR